MRSVGRAPRGEDRLLGLFHDLVDGAGHGAVALHGTVNDTGKHRRRADAGQFGVALEVNGRWSTVRW
jgi:hypothetical protein